METYEITVGLIVISILIYYLLFSERKGLNFAVKANFIAAFLAPVVSYFIISYTVDSITDKVSVFGIFILTTVILTIISILTTMKAYIDNPDCDIQNIKYKDTLFHASKLVLVNMLTFIAVLLSPILQAPFTNILRYYQTQNPQKFIYLVVGFYMAFVSLSGSVISYMPAFKDSCKKTDTEIKLEYEEGTKKEEKDCSKPVLEIDLKLGQSMIFVKDIPELKIKKGDRVTYSDKNKNIVDKNFKKYLTTEFMNIIK